MAHTLGQRGIHSSGSGWHDSIQWFFLGVQRTFVLHRLGKNATSNLICDVEQILDSSCAESHVISVIVLCSSSKSKTVIPFTQIQFLVFWYNYGISDLCQKAEIPFNQRRLPTPGGRFGVRHIPGCRCPPGPNDNWICDRSRGGYKRWVGETSWLGFLRSPMRCFISFRSLTIPFPPRFSTSENQVSRSENPFSECEIQFSKCELQFS